MLLFGCWHCRRADRVQGRASLGRRRRAGARRSLLFVCIPPVTILCARQLGIGKVYVLMSLSYGLVALMGRKLFGEPVSRRQVQGLALITLGCLVYTL